MCTISTISTIIKEMLLMCFLPAFLLASCLLVLLWSQMVFMSSCRGLISIPHHLLFVHLRLLQPKWHPSGANEPQHNTRELHRHSQEGKRDQGNRGFFFWSLSINLSILDNSSFALHSEHTLCGCWRGTHSNQGRGRAEICVQFGGEIQREDHCDVTDGCVNVCNNK